MKRIFLTLTILTLCVTFVGAEVVPDLAELETDTSIHQILKTKFIEGNALFMSFVAVSLILGLALCIERIIYLSLAKIDNNVLVEKISKLIEEQDVASAKELCKNTVGPVASICYQGLLRIDDAQDSIERSIESFSDIQIGILEKGCSWIKLFIAMAPSLGFLGTVIGMVIAFDTMQAAGDISPTIVAEGMKVALITTIFGIVSGLVLQLFYNFIITRIDSIVSDMEETAISLLDIISEYKRVNHQ